MTQQMVFLALFAKVISKVTGNTSLCLTTVQENRDIDGARELFGALLTSLPITIRNLDTQHFDELFAQVKKTTLAVYEYRHV
ncbi:condensation domain-containing protein, partial [Pseudoalteromonas ruthenica]|uniref:condensation domain-containing protein n=1 Tax=Pseudoalteromonas ruthenica TaxID=151081 RepID=UPI002015EEAE